MQILITGGAGYIGSHTCVVLLEAGYNVVVADDLRNSRVEVLKRASFIFDTKNAMKEFKDRSNIELL